MTIEEIKENQDKLSKITSLAPNSVVRYFIKLLRTLPFKEGSSLINFYDHLVRYHGQEVYINIDPAISKEEGNWDITYKVIESLELLDGWGYHIKYDNKTNFPCRIAFYE